jgi:hypothetical protein
MDVDDLPLNRTGTDTLRCVRARGSVDVAKHTPSIMAMGQFVTSTHQLRPLPPRQAFRKPIPTLIASGYRACYRLWS